ncbi:10976_t:CDS:2 [Dentiscutata erythropus]|uniref:10976_t:CDS:1 n=1 Tax=Dentiscutata erythropus TaxID=1348616 RepID=A0A9N9IA47_9GLOM|nr:10976_t:CDS:2 [Dentiscutata erythropus]
MCILGDGVYLSAEVDNFEIPIILKNINRLIEGIIKILKSKNTPRVTAVKVPITETAETIITAAQSRYGPEISIELTLVDSEGKIVDPTLDIVDITNEN